MTTDTLSKSAVRSRFAPSPSGRMHLGNIYTAVISYLVARHSGGEWILRIEDIDPDRSKEVFTRQIEDDLRWLGMVWDERYVQSERTAAYEQALAVLNAAGLTYPCRCRRADIMATQAPHQSDGRIVYAGTCRPTAEPPFPHVESSAGATRLYVPDSDIVFDDAIYGRRCVNLARYCGDFVVRRADGAWAYQLAVVVDDAMMGITDIVRGADLLLSTAQQIYLFDLLEPLRKMSEAGTPRLPRYIHLPLICNGSGVRLSKRDRGIDMASLRQRHTPESLLGLIAHLAGQQPSPSPIGMSELVSAFDLDSIPRTDRILVDSSIIY